MIDTALRRYSRKIDESEFYNKTVTRFSIKNVLRVFIGWNEAENIIIGICPLFIRASWENYWLKFDTVFAVGRMNSNPLRL